MRRRLFAGSALTALALVACNAILGLDGDTVIGGADGAPGMLPDGSLADGTIGTADGATHADGGGDANVRPDSSLDAGPDADDSPLGIRLVIGDLGGAGNLDGPAGSARFMALSGIARDADGNRYVIDSGGLVIRKIAASDGAVTTFAGQWNQAGSDDDAGTSARFGGLTAITSDGKNTLYVTESGNGVCRVRRIDTRTGNVVTLAGQQGCAPIPKPPPAIPVSSDGGLFGPTGIALGTVSDGTVDRVTLFVSDPPTIKTCDPQTGELTHHCGKDKDGLGDPGPGDCKSVPTNAVDLAWDDASPTLYFRQSSSLYRLASPKNVELVTGLSGPTVDGGLTGTPIYGSGLVFDPPGGGSLVFGTEGQLRIGELAGNGLVPLAGSNTERFWFDSATPEKARFESINGIARAEDRVFDIADAVAVRRYSKSGVTTIAGRGRANDYANDPVGTSARIGSGFSLTRTAAGLVYFYDRSHATVRSYDPATGAVAAVAGKLDTSAESDAEGTLSSVGDGIVFDGDAIIYSTTSAKGGPAVRSIDPTSGTIETVEPGKSLGGALASDLKGRVFATSPGHQAVIVWRSPNLREDVAGLDGKSDWVDLPGVDARFGGITGLCYDASRDAILVADAANRAVRKIALAGAKNEVSTVAGSPLEKGKYVDGTKEVARFRTLDKIACDGRGFAYVNDPQASTIRRIDVDTGETHTVAGVPDLHGILPGTLPGGLNRPLGPVVLPNGHLLVGSDAESAIVDIRLPPP